MIELVRQIVGEPVTNVSLSNFGYVIEYLFSAFFTLVIIVLLFRALYNIMYLFTCGRG